MPALKKLNSYNIIFFPIFYLANFVLFMFNKLIILKKSFSLKTIKSKKSEYDLLLYKEVVK